MIESTIALIVAVTTGFGLILEKLRQSRCTHIRSCCCEIDRDPPEINEIVEAKVVYPPSRE